MGGLRCRAGCRRAKRGPGRGTAWLDFEHDEAERFAARAPDLGTCTGYSVTPSQPSRVIIEPAPERKSATALLGIASARRPATIVLMPMTRPRGVGERAAGVSRRQADIGLHPGLRTETAEAGRPRGSLRSVSAPTKPSGLPMAIASSPGADARRIGRRCRSGRFLALTRSVAMIAKRIGRRDAWRRVRDHPRVGRGVAARRATCALVTMTPSLDQMTPEPLPPRGPRE